ncbi:MAG: winged helix-turn-helix transcriptional regulator, partial [Nanoarchaeota archaeon]
MANQIYNKRDMKLFSTLRQNGRMSLTEISRETNIPVSTIYERLRGYYGNIIKRYTILLDFTKLGYGVRVSLFLKVNNNQREKLLKYFQMQDNVNNAYRINNCFDILCEAVFIDMSAAEQFSKDIEQKFHTSKVQLFYIL